MTGIFDGLADAIVISILLVFTSPIVTGALLFRFHKSSKENFIAKVIIKVLVSIGAGIVGLLLIREYSVCALPWLGGYVAIGFFILLILQMPRNETH